MDRLGHRLPERDAQHGADFHVAGIVVHAIPAELDRVAREIAALPGVRVHGSSALGKLVVTVEATATGAILDSVDAMQRVRGVMATALVYQHGEHEGDQAPARSEGDSP